ncbi:MAG TPA: hypothetical protein VFV51_13670 [Vicinamibacterales bacterium]|nr:hypothetical protein [Vicinamibacterales bacterium]
MDLVLPASHRVGLIAHLALLRLDALLQRLDLSPERIEFRRLAREAAARPEQNGAIASPAHHRTACAGVPPECSLERAAHRDIVAPARDGDSSLRNLVA